MDVPPGSKAKIQEWSTSGREIGIVPALPQLRQVTQGCRDMPQWLDPIAYSHGSVVLSHGLWGFQFAGLVAVLVAANFGKACYEIHMEHKVTVGSKAGDSVERVLRPAD